MSSQTTGALPPLYTKLNTSRRQIRLLELDLSEDDDGKPLNCRLIESTVEGDVPYEALSYVWGNSGDRVPCTLNGHAMRITTNLDKALRYLRKPSIYLAAVDASPNLSLDHSTVDLSIGPFKASSSRAVLAPNTNSPMIKRRLWVDALCINQEDLQERCEQVKLMFSLYSNAARLLVWLGEAENESDLAMDLICQLQVCKLKAVLKQYPYSYFSPWESDQIIKWSGQPQWYHAFMKLHGSAGGEHLNPQDPKEWVAYQHLMDRPWWQRSWVVQELVGGQRRAAVGCGSKWVPWSAFPLASSEIRRLKSNAMMQRLRRLATKSDLVSELDSMCLRYEAKLLTGWGGIMLPLFYTVSKKATLPVDRIYSLLSFHPSISLEPDYTKSPEEVFTSFTRLTIQSTNVLAFLAFNRSPKNLTLPSWVPDYSCEFKEEEYNITIPRGVYGADGNPYHNSLTGLSTRVQRDSNVVDELIISGFVFDQPSHIAPPWQAAPEERDELLFKLAEDYEAAVKNLKSTPSQEYLHDALWRTLIWNATPESTYPAPADYGSSYVSVLKPHNILIDTNKLMRGIFDIGEHHRIIPDIGLGKVYYESLVKHGLNRRFFTTSKGYLGSGPIEMRDDDSICVLIGFKTPVVLRQRVPDNTFEWIGPAYVHGIMHGESLAGGPSLRTFTLK